MKRHLLLLVILTIGIWLRFDRLASIPSSLSHDETAIAYNAYSLLKTGKDEYNVKFPVLFRSFDDYKLPGMVYFTMPFVALFGRTELAARLPSALFGSMAIIVMYVLSIELLQKNRWIKIGKRDVDAALFPTLLLAVQPWHINFSRQLFESNGAVFWFLLATFFLLKSRRTYGFILWAGLSYVMSLYFYYSVRLVIPFVALLYLITHWSTIQKQWKISALTVIICFIAFFPLGKEMLSPGGWQRINTVSVINDANFLHRKEGYANIMAAHPTLLNTIIYNRRVALVQTVLENYWKNISPLNLFMLGTGTYGVLYPFEIVLLLLGVFAVFSLPIFSRQIIFLWLVTGFLPGALTVDQPNTLRTLIAAPVFAILSGLGIYELALLAHNKKRLVPIIITTCIMLVLWFTIEFPKFLYGYFVVNPTHNSVAFGDGNKQMVAYVRANENRFDRIYISGYYWRPYIFMLYWGGIDPAYYQNHGTREHFGNYYFTSASWDTNGMKLGDASFDMASLPHDKNTLFLLAPSEYTLHQNYFTKIADINGDRTSNVFVAALFR